MLLTFIYAELFHFGYESFADPSGISTCDNLAIRFDHVRVVDSFQ